MTALQQKQRVLYADALRFLAIIGVMFVHATTLYLYDNNKSFQMWGVGVFYNILFRWCIPIFIMLSGMFLLDPRHEFSLKTFLKKRFLTVLIPFAVWSVIYSVRAHDINPNLSFGQLLKLNISGPIYYHLWFVYTLVGLYLITPVLRIFVKYASKDEIKYMLLVWFFGMSVVSFFKDALGINIGFDLSFFSGYIGFYVLGYYLSNLELSGKTLKTVYAVAIAGFVISFLGTLLPNAKNYFISNYTFYSYLTPALTFTSVGLFLYVKSLETTLQKSAPICKVLSVKNLSRIIFGTYLLHVLVLEFLKSSYIGFDFAKYGSINILIIPLLAFTLFIVSFGIMYLINKLAELDKVFKLLNILY